MQNWKYLEKTIRNILLRVKSNKAENIKFKLTLKRNSLRTARNVFWDLKIFSDFFLIFENFSYSSRSHRKYWRKVELKNCKISGNFGDLEILTDGTVPETVETLVKKEPTTETKSAGLDYTAFMINKEKSSKYNLYSKYNILYKIMPSPSLKWRLFPFFIHILATRSAVRA